MKIWASVSSTKRVVTVFRSTDTGRLEDFVFTGTMWHDLEIWEQLSVLLVKLCHYSIQRDTHCRAFA